MKLKPGDKVRLKNNVGSSFYDRREIYISGTKGSIAKIVTPNEFFLHYGHKFGNRALIEQQMKRHTRYPVHYETLMPLSVDDPMGFEIIDQTQEGRYDLIYASDLEKVE